MKQRYIQYANHIRPSDAFMRKLEKEMTHQRSSRSRHRPSHRAGYAIAVLALVIVVCSMIYGFPRGTDHTASLTAATTKPRVEPSAMGDPSATPVPDAVKWTGMEYPPGFSITHMNLCSGGYLICGADGSGDFQSKVPTLMRCGLNGEAQWAYHSGENVGEIYTDAIMSGDSIIAVRTQGLESVIDIFEDGEKISESGILPAVRRIFPASDGFFVAFAPSEEESTLSMYSLAGNLLWNLNTDGKAYYHDVASQNGTHIAVGKKTMGKGDYLTEWGMMIAFDDSGSVLWSYESEPSFEYMEALCTDDGNVVALARMSESRAPAFIAEYDASGERWRTELKIDEAIVGVPYARALAMHRGEYIAATLINTIDEATIFLHVVDNNGERLTDGGTTVKSISLDEVKLESRGGQLYCIGYGRRFDRDQPFENADQAPFATIIEAFETEGQ